MPQPKQYDTPADRLKAFRKRAKAMEKPSTDQETVLQGAEDQLNRQGRKYPLAVWRRAAAHFIEGDGTPTAKTKALKGLVAGDPEWSKRVKAFVLADRAAASRRFVEAQGWTLKEDGSANSAREIDLLVAAIEAGEPLEPSGEPYEPDPKWIELQAFLATPKPVIRLCEYCGAPPTKEINGHPYCYRHGVPAVRPSAEAYIGTPAQYINSNFGKDQPPQPTLAEMYKTAQDENRAALQRASTAMVGPAPEFFITSAGGFQRKDSE